MVLYWVREINPAPFISGSLCYSKDPSVPQRSCRCLPRQDSVVKSLRMAQMASVSTARRWQVALTLALRDEESN